MGDVQFGQADRRTGGQPDSSLEPEFAAGGPAAVGPSASPPGRLSASPSALGTVAIVGGGCYGTFYAGQLERARARGAASYRRVLVVDRDPGCRAAHELEPDPARELVVAEWADFFDRFLARSGSATDGLPDAIVPSPLMPHLMHEWLVRRARARWPGRPIESRPLELPVGTPYDRLGPDGTRYVSFADWLCPVHCIEPSTCPVIDAPRTWEMSDAVAGVTQRLSRSRRAAGPVLFVCRHRVYGVGMFDVSAVLAGERSVAEAGAAGEAVDIVVGTVSACHGAVGVLHLGPALAPPGTPSGSIFWKALGRHHSLDRDIMLERHQVEVIIVGGGPAGLCAAMYAGRGMLRTVLLERGVPGGELLNTEWIEDYPGFEKIKGAELARLMLEHARVFGADVRQENVESIDRRDDGIFEVTTSRGLVFEAPAVILTAGGTPNKLGVPGELEYAGRGVSYCAVCDGAFFKGETIAVVGGGDAAVEEADYLTRYGERVYLIHRRDQLRASKHLQERLFANPKIEVIWNKEVLELVGGPSGLTTLELQDTVTAERSSLAATGCFVFIGFKPNSWLIRGHAAHDPSGYLITDDRMMTSIPGLFAAGDLRVQLTRQITTAVGDATTAAIAVEKFLADRKARAERKTEVGV